MVYTFTLRDNVKFHNGNVVTAEDVKYSLERVSGLLDGTPLISTLATIKSVDILDEKTVQVTVESANTELIYSFVAAIIPAGSGEDESADPIGTGPFSFVSYKPQQGSSWPGTRSTGRKACPIWIRWSLRSSTARTRPFWSCREAPSTSTPT